MNGWPTPLAGVVAFTRELLQLAVPIAIGVLPIFLHILDKLMERYSPLSEDTIRLRMAGDSRAAVAAIGRSEDVFRSVKTYFDYERVMHFVVTLTVFNILSLYVAQTQCTGSLLKSTAMTFLEIIALLVFLVIFLLKVSNNAFDPAALHPARRWVIASIAAFGVVVVTEVALYALYGAG
jgi:hypothetical protein